LQRSHRERVMPAREKEGRGILENKVGRKKGGERASIKAI